MGPKAGYGDDGVRWEEHHGYAGEDDGLRLMMACVSWARAAQAAWARLGWPGSVGPPGGSEGGTSSGSSGNSASQASL